MMQRRMLAVLGLAALTAAACSDGGTTGGTGAGGKHKITLVQGLSGEEFYETMACGAKAEAAKKGNVDLQVQGPAKFDPTLQTPVLNAVIAAKPEAILIAPTDVKAMIAPLAQAKAAGIKIILVDTVVDSPDIGLSRISSNNEEGGKQAAVALAGQVGDKGKVLVVSTDPGVSTVDARITGFQKEIEANHPNMDYVGVQYSHNDQTEAQKIINAELAKDPDLVGVFAVNLNSATGVAAGLRSAGKAGSVKMVGFDAGPAQIQQLTDGIVQALIAQRPAQMGSDGVDQALNAIDGKDVTATIATDFVTITKDNMTQADVKSAFYEKSC